MARNLSVSDIPTLLEKAKNYDKDERHMAISDLNSLLQSDVRLDQAMEDRIQAAVLTRLEVDTSSEVQSLSVRCLSILVTRAQPKTVSAVVAQLTDHLLGKKTELRDIYSIGLQKVIKEVSTLPRETVSASATKLLSRAKVRASSDHEVALQRDCLDILAEYLRKFGGHMDGSLHGSMLNSMLSLLDDESQPVRKRAISSLGHLAYSVSDEQLERMIESLLASIEAASGAMEITYVQSIGTVSRSVGWRLGRHLGHIVPILLNSVGSNDADGDMDEEPDNQSNDLRETCFQAFESFVLRCPTEITSYLDDIRRRATQFMTYDPNYSYASDEEDDSDEYDSDYGDYDDNYDDDDDTSWKVRRASIKVLDAMIRTRPEQLSTFYDELGSLLVDRFKEREESVKLDVLAAFSSLLNATAVTEGTIPARGVGGVFESESKRATVVGDTAIAAEVSSLGPGAGAPPSLVRQRSAVPMLHELLDAIIVGVEKLLNASTTKSVKVKSSIWHMIAQLYIVANGLQVHVPRIVPLAAASLKDKHGPLRLDVLQCVRRMLDVCPPESFADSFAVMVPMVLECINDEWYKTVAEALRVLGRISAALRPRMDGAFVAPTIDSTPFIEPCYNALLPKLSARDIDQEIKESAITSAGLFLAHLGDKLTTRQLADILPLFQERLTNEITRISTLKALRMVASSEHGFNLSPILGDCMPDLASFLLQSSRPLKQATFECLAAIVQGHNASVEEDSMRSVLQEAAGMVSESDLQLANQALNLSVAVLNSRADWAPMLRPVLTAAVELAGSALLQGDALESTRAFFYQLTAGEGAASMDVTFTGLLDMLFGRAMADDGAAASGGATGRAGLQKHAIRNVASCAAVLAVNAETGARNKVVDGLLDDAAATTDGSVSDIKAYLSLVCIGEIGRNTDLTESHGSGVFKTILGAFDSAGEDVKSAAASALGGVCVGNMSAGLPVIEEQLEKEPRLAYLLLSSLREILSRHEVDGFDVTEHVGRILPMLTDRCSDEDEGVRNMTAECLGKTACVSPSKIISVLADMASDSNSFARWTVASSLKYAVSSESVAPFLADSVSRLLSGLTDADINVRRAALLSLNSVVHHRVDVIRPFLRDGMDSKDDEAKADDIVGASIEDIGVFPVLYHAMRVDTSLIREVDLGPFKHKLDDGLPLRKAAFSCMDSMLEKARDRVDPAMFVSRLIVTKGGLSDPADDVKMLCHQLLTKMCHWTLWRRHVLESLKEICQGLRAAFNKMDQRGVKATASDDFIRSALRAVEAISRLPDAMSVTDFTGLLEDLKRKEPVRLALESIGSEHGGATEGGGGAGGGGAGGAGDNGKYK